ncbi:hypothetical protein R6Q59_026998 [Mikania micrantha]
MIIPNIKLLASIASFILILASNFGSNESQHLDERPEESWLKTGKLLLSSLPKGPVPPPGNGCCNTGDCGNVGRHYPSYIIFCLLPVHRNQLRLKLLQNKLIPKNDVTSEEIDAIENKNVDTKPFVASVEELEHGKLPPEEILSLPMFKIFNQNGAGSPDFFGNLMTQFTKNPEMMNTVNQLAQQMDGNQDLTRMSTSMGGSSVGGGSGNLDL